MKNNTFSELKAIIDNNNRFLLLSHVNPDGDNIGSLAGLKMSLELMGKTAVAVSNGVIPKNLTFIKGTESFLTPDDTLVDYDCCIVVDASALSRLGKCAQWIKEGKPLLCLDHHENDTGFGDAFYIDSTAAACAQVVGKFLFETGMPVNEDIAEALYTGMITDSGSFMFASTTEETLAVAAKLRKFNFDLGSLRGKLFGSVPVQKVRLLGYVLSNVEYRVNGEFTFIYIDGTKMAELGVSTPDFDGVVNRILDIEKVSLAILLRDTENGTIKGSIRTKRSDLDATLLAGKFHGGGHKAAAGFTLYPDQGDTVGNLLLEAEKFLKG